MPYVVTNTVKTILTFKWQGVNWKKTQCIGYSPHNINTPLHQQTIQIWCFPNDDCRMELKLKKCDSFSLTNSINCAQRGYKKITPTN